MIAVELHKTLVNQKKPTAVALGFFDGVHLGHQKILSKTVEYLKFGVKPCVFTFFQNPRSVIEVQKIEYLTTPDEKVEAMEKLGIKAVYMLDFNIIKDVTPEDFVFQVLKKTLNAKFVVCGFNYHFGSGGNANADDLKSLCSQCGIQVYVQPPVYYDGKVISSSRIRKAFKECDGEIAMKMLGSDKI